MNGNNKNGMNGVKIEILYFKMTPYDMLFVV